MNTSETTQYTIEIPGRGFYEPWLGHVIDDPLHVIDSLDDAMKTLESVRSKFTSMGCPEIGETAQIVSRTATLTFSEWTLEKLFV